MDCAKFCQMLELGCLYQGKCVKTMATKNMAEASAMLVSFKQQISLTPSGMADLIGSEI